ncbi:MAG: carboxypeptidase regulatory-like domain-containing protein [Acidobacteriota bacterium]
MANSGARAQDDASAHTAARGTLHGHVADPTGAMIPGAQVTVSAAQGSAVAKTTSDASGAYVVHGLPAGNYVLQVTAPGFALFVSKPVAVQPGEIKADDIKMALENEQQQVEVNGDSGPTVSTEADQNANAIVLKGSDLDALSDDPDELSNELQALAGPSAGPNGGQIYIDGFTGGQLPPKSAIREIRINQNPFSAEFDRLGYGRIEILTKPGTDKLHGRVFLLGNDDTFNTGNPFTRQIPPYHSIQGNGTISGPIDKNASYFFAAEQRNTQDASIYTADTALPSGGTFVPTTISGGLFSPRTRTAVTPRVDLQLGQKNTLTLRYQFWRNYQTGAIGSTALPTQDSTAQVTENAFQLDDTQIVTDRIVQEVRFEYRRGANSNVPEPAAIAQVPASAPTAPTVTVPHYFTGGANSTQSQTGHSDHLELQDFVTMTAGKHAIKFGTWIRDNRQATSSTAGYNGIFNFPSLNAYIDTLNGMAQGKTVAQIQQACPSGQQCTPIKLTYTTGPLGFVGNLFDAALFYQDDWKVNPFFTFSAGLRWETQNHVADHSDFAPRIAFAYALDGHKNHRQAKTVVRGGIGFFYDRFQIQDLMNLEQYNGTANSQKQTVISNPTCFDATSLQAALSQGCAGANQATPTSPQYDSITPHYRSPYAEQMGISLERQLTKKATLTFTYLRSFGVHQMVVRNANPYTPLPGTVFYNASTGPRLLASQGNNSIVDQYFPEAVYKQNQIIVNVNAQFTRNFGMVGFYNWTQANSDGGNGSSPSNSYDLSLDYGRAPFIRPQFLFLMGNYSGPWGLSFNPFLVVQQGKPYSIVTANDLTGDNFFNDRPAYATSASNPNSVVQTNYGALDTNPASPSQGILPPDSLLGPSAVAFNLRMSRSFGIGPHTESAGGPQGGGFHGPRGGGGGGFHGGFGGGPMGGRGFHGPAGTGRKYSLTFSVQALNLFNNIDYGTPSGTIVPTPLGNGLNGPGVRFEQSTRLAGGLFASPAGSAARRIFVQSFFTF